MVKKHLTVAQIGCGYWGPNLLRNLTANKECVVKTVADLSKDRRSFIKNLYPSVHVTDNAKEVFDDDSIDALIIATPAAAHFELVIKALESHKHVLVEKPMAGSVKEVEHIGAIAKQNGLVAMAGHTFLYEMAVRYLKRLIDSGEIGDVRYIYSQRLNLGRIRNDVDALWNFGPHDISIIQYLLGDIPAVSVIKHGMDYIQDGINDVVFLNIKYPNRIMANIHVSWLDPCKVRRMTIVGSKKMVVYDDIADNKIAIYDKGIDRMAVLGKNMDYDREGVLKFSCHSGDVLLPQIEYIEPLKVEIAHFIDCIQKGTQCLTGVEHALSVLKILSWE